MPPGKRLPRDFYARDTVLVAREILGATLVRVENGQRLGGMILEAEAYRGEEDLGCHARAGLTRRTRVMYGPPGHAYVYFTYGMHWMLNFVTQAEGFPAAVLVRAILPQEGREVIAARRNPQPARLLDGRSSEAVPGAGYRRKPSRPGSVQRRVRDFRRAWDEHAG